eukprot:CAMPEP_0177627176 /NCGR_PEP_ID=MMETSP0419_2-20121207/31060_1 /TAXON_ID=582737 /ORGANISM="Tetraselmis sp., Strain GSL018" /LENGTH=179 /DNA_ID=CAMNT_0019128305 /DNA_START=638 /DNA_END=1174 /DNA_ORIENTATION=-
MKDGMIQNVREAAPEVFVFGYGNEPSGKYKNDVEAHAQELDGPPLDGPSLLPGNRGTWKPEDMSALVDLAVAARSPPKAGQGKAQTPAPGAPESPLPERCASVAQPAKAAPWAIAVSRAASCAAAPASLSPPASPRHPAGWAGPFPAPLTAMAAAPRMAGGLPGAMAPPGSPSITGTGG